MAIPQKTQIKKKMSKKMSNSGKIPESDDFFDLVSNPANISDESEDEENFDKVKPVSPPPAIFDEPYQDDETSEEDNLQEKSDEPPDEPEDSDYDFDMSYLESEEESIEEIPESILKTAPPAISSFKSRFSHGSFEMERLGELKKQCSSYAIKVAAYKQDVSMLREYYGILRTIWMVIRPIYGQLQWDEFNNLSDECRILLNSISSSSKIKDEVFEKLLTFDGQMQRLMQLTNLGFEVEKWRSGTRASKQIIQ